MHETLVWGHNRCLVKVAAIIIVIIIINIIIIIIAILLHEIIRLRVWDIREIPLEEEKLICQSCY